MVTRVRWRLGELGLAAELVIASAGRGLSGALSIQLAIGLADLPTSGTTPALMLIPDEPEPALRTRLTRWIEPALERARAASPLRF